MVLANPPVCPSVSPMPVLCLMNRHIVTLFDDLIGASFLYFDF